jgi:EF-P beta-lysylation protein EpmB
VPDLLEALGLAGYLSAASVDAARSFSLLVPRNYATLMTPGDPNDPLLRQVLPLASELEKHPGYGPDPVGDGEALRAAGLLQKYGARALLVVTGACAVHCRFCFRRHFPYSEAALQRDRTVAAIDRIGADGSISEVILSGGDPLMLDDGALADLVDSLCAIPHLRRLRLHTRLPIVLPSRVTPALCTLLAGTRLPTLVVVHANHARELSAEAGAALADLRGAGLTLLNQGVLLRGVNDSVEALAALAEALFENGVLPYYLHLLDRVAGAAHFEVSAAQGAALIGALRARLPGYLVPRLVRETPGRAFKQPVA